MSDPAIAAVFFILGTVFGLMIVVCVDGETERLRTAIRKHRDYRGDDRCFQDDAELYETLPEGDTRPKKETEVTLENCRRYIECRQNGREYISPQRRIDELEEELKKLKNEHRDEECRYTSVPAPDELLAAGRKIMLEQEAQMLCCVCVMWDTIFLVVAVITVIQKELRLDSKLKMSDGQGDRMLKWFKYDHLPLFLQAVSKPFQDLAVVIIETIDAGPERTVALRKLLEAKDAAVRAMIVPGG